MITRLAFTSLEFEALCFANDRDRLPYPLRHVMDGNDDAVVYRTRVAALEKLVPRINDEMAVAFSILMNPMVRVHVHGHAGPNLAKEVRAYVGIGTDRAVLALQWPDSDPGMSGQIMVKVCNHADLPGVLVEGLPPADPGRLDSIDALKSDLGYEPEDGGGWNRRLTLDERVQRMFLRELKGWGEVTVCPGPFYDNTQRHPDAIGFFWMDFAEDGRYFVRHDDSVIKALPMDAECFASTIHSFINRSRDLHAARANTFRS